MSLKCFFVATILLLTSIVGLGEEVPKLERDTTSRIVNGVQAQPGRYPYFVSIVFQNGAGGCGGSLVAPIWVLTAAHCFSKSAPPAGVFISDWDVQTWAGGVEYRDVVKRFIHPDFNENTLDNDFMLLLLSTASSKTPVKMDDGSVSLVSGRDLTTMGFGDINPHGDPGDREVSKFPRFLQRVVVDYVPSSTCSSQYAGFSVITSNMICSGGSNKDSCQGDSGGPLIVSGKNAKGDIQVGVVSWGLGCAQANRPGVYSRVSSGRSWISSVMNGCIQCPPNSTPNKVCPTKFDECDCDSGFFRDGGTCKQCLQCPSNSNAKKACPRKAKHCGCDKGLVMNSDPLQCVPCGKYSCPPHSTQTKKCATKFKHCKCDNGFRKNKQNNLCEQKN
eukprot:CAMPEP_0204837986 /NCGR_PEP_ID=MMETSP1346-20131115/29486_1 /ASSEMBLY_ACC=CAM_ASM_000771 /TAXON_ID=215587 /ORGANISM="Aplanochytrium stocchinoi, Strain GSBS06" /LENGTH=388 /DNA_ID=CAMNT_0051973753 /DNA_START=576 /DNA_END=1742 /DNA_ORIENTATION=+